MIIKQGDLLKSNVDVIIHQCNCFCVMGAGFAKALKNKYPIVLKQDKKTSIGDQNKLGHYSKAIVSNNPYKTVYNLYGQYGYGKRYQDEHGINTNYNALQNSIMSAGYDIILDNGFLFKDEILVGMPYLIGCGLAGGKQEIVTNIVNQFEKTFKRIKVIAYQYI